MKNLDKILYNNFGYPRIFNIAHLHKNQHTSIYIHTIRILSTFFYLRYLHSLLQLDRVTSVLERIMPIYSLFLASTHVAHRHTHVWSTTIEHTECIIKRANRGHRCFLYISKGNYTLAHEANTCTYHSTYESCSFSYERKDYNLNVMSLASRCSIAWDFRDAEERCITRERVHANAVARRERRGYRLSRNDRL